MIPVKDFNFLIGKWKIVNKRLKERLNSSNEWVEFPATMETGKIMNGMGTMDEFKTSHFGEEFVGLSIRLLNPETNEWTIYWADTMYPEHKLTEQVTGSFENGIGEFFGKELYKGQEVQLRFIWKQETPDTARWEHAYYDEKNDEWETNWIMEFTKAEV